MCTVPLSSSAPEKEPVSSMALMRDILVLMNETLGQSAQIQGKAADDISGALSKMADDIKALNAQAADIQKNIDAHNADIATAVTWQKWLCYASIALGIAAPALCGVLSARQIFMLDAEAVLKGIGGVAGVGEGVASIYGGVKTGELAGLTKELAGINALVTAQNGAQQYYQSSSKWLVDSLGETLTQNGALGQSFTQDLFGVSRAISQSNQQMLSGIYGSR